MLIRLGAMWESNSGKSVMTGTINRDTRIIVLKNTKKEKDNQPDYHLFLAPNEKRDEESGGYGGGEESEDKL